MSIENPEFKIEIEKPEILYHASENKNIQEIEPRAESVRDKNEGNVVFATPDIALASCFIVPSTDSWTQKSIFTLPTGEKIHVLIVSDKERFKEADKGGAIYSLPSDNFETDLEKGMKDKEWISRESVKPTDKVEYKTGMQAMIENGVKVFFVDEKIFQKIRESEDHGAEILKTLKPEETKK
jgi:hypothetical protein